jgi:hypothetical protein
MKLTLLILIFVILAAAAFEEPHDVFTQSFPGSQDGQGLSGLISYIFF